MLAASACAGKVWDEPKGIDTKGWGPLDRIYETAMGHLCLAAVGPDVLSRLALVNGPEGVDALDNAELEAAREARFTTKAAANWARHRPALRTSPVRDWSVQLS